MKFPDAKAIITETYNPEHIGTYNRRLAQKIGICAATVYQQLIRKYEYYRAHHMLTADDMFYSTEDDLGESTGVTRRQQETAIRKLIDLGMIRYRLCGCPARRHFGINFDLDILTNLLNGINTDDLQENEPAALEINQFHKNAKLVSQKDQTSFTKTQNYHINLNNKTTATTYPTSRNPSCAVDVHSTNEEKLEIGEYTEEQQIVVDRLAHYNIFALNGKKLAWLRKMILNNDLDRINRNIDFVVNVERPDKDQLSGAILNAIREARAGAAAAAKKRREARETKLQKERIAQTYEQEQETRLSAFEAHAVICQWRGLSFVKKAYESGMKKITALGLTEEEVIELAKDFKESNIKKPS